MEPVPDGDAISMRKSSTPAAFVKVIESGEEDYLAQRLLDASFNFEDDDEEEVLIEEEEETPGVFDRFYSGVASIYTRAKRVILSEDTENMMTDAMKIANSLLDSEYNSMQILGAVRILSGFESNRPILTGIDNQDMVMIKHAFYWWQFAEAAFGWGLVHGIKFEAGLRGFVQGATNSNDDVLATYCKLKREDVRYTQWEGKPCAPGNSVVVDHRTKSIVWAVRGTYSMGDVLTDIVAHSTEFLGPEYLGHAGMVKVLSILAAILLLSSLNSILF